MRAGDGGARRAEASLPSRCAVAVGRCRPGPRDQLDRQHAGRAHPGLARPFDAVSRALLRQRLLRPQCGSATGRSASRRRRTRPAPSWRCTATRPAKAAASASCRWPAGEMQVKATVVAYLRACQQEVALSEQAFSVDGAAGRAAHRGARSLRAQRLRPPGRDRRRSAARCSTTTDRLLILDTELGSEILERNGTDIRFSPTGRYLSVRSDNAVGHHRRGRRRGRRADRRQHVAPRTICCGSTTTASSPSRARPGAAPGWPRRSTSRSRSMPSRPPRRAATLEPDDGLVDVNLENDVVRIIGGLERLRRRTCRTSSWRVDYPEPSGFDDDNFADLRSMILLDAMGPVSPLARRLRLRTSRCRRSRRAGRAGEAVDARRRRRCAGATGTRARSRRAAPSA